MLPVASRFKLLLAQYLELRIQSGNAFETCVRSVESHFHSLRLDELHQEDDFGIIDSVIGVAPVRTMGNEEITRPHTVLKFPTHQIRCLIERIVAAESHG